MGDANNPSPANFIGPNSLIHILLIRDEKCVNIHNGPYSEVGFNLVPDYLQLYWK